MSRYAGLRVGDEVKWNERTVYDSGMVVDWEEVSKTVIVYDPIEMQLVRLPVEEVRRSGRYVDDTEAEL